MCKNRSKISFIDNHDRKKGRERCKETQRKVENETNSTYFIHPNFFILNYIIYIDIIIDLYIDMYKERKKIGEKEKKRDIKCFFFIDNPIVIRNGMAWPN